MLEIIKQHLELEEAKLSELDIQTALQAGKVEGLKTAIRMFSAPPMPDPVSTPVSSPVPTETVHASTEIPHGFTKPVKHRPKETKQEEKSRPKRRPYKEGPERDKWDLEKRKGIVRLILAGATSLHSIAQGLEMSDQATMPYLEHYWFDKNSSTYQWSVTELGMKESGEKCDTQ